MMGSLLRRIVFFALAWWIVAEGSLDAWLLALAGIAVATAASFRLLPPASTPDISLLGLLAFLGYFIGQSLLGGFQVARLALQARPLLRPALLELPLTLPDGLPRLLFAATLGLMPGTLGVRLGEHSLHVHVLDRDLPIARKADILASRIARMFGERR